MDIQNHNINKSNDEFMLELDKWNSSRNLITASAVKNNEIIVSFGKHELVFTCPISEKESYIVQSRNKQYNWLDDVNIYCLEKKPTPVKLLNVISKQLAKIKDETENVSCVKLRDSVNINIDFGFDLERYNKNKELESLISSSKSMIESQQKRGQLFTPTVVGKIIISEFMKLWDLSRNIHSQFKIDIVNNNIYQWKLKFSNFSNNDLIKDLENLEVKFGYNYIEVDIFFHGTFYPNYPPVVKVLRPRLQNSLMHKIANTRMIQLDYWLPTRTMVFIVDKLHQLLDKHAKVFVDTDLNDRSKYGLGSMLQIEAHLLDLASFVDIANNDDIDDERYDKIFSNKLTSDKKKQISNDITVWKAGTGYGHSNTNQWDVTSYVKSLEERDRQAQAILNRIIIEIQDSKSPKLIYNAIQYSVLIKYIKSLLDDTTLLEIRKHTSLYQIIFNLIGNIVNEDAIFLFDKLPDTKEGKSLFEIFKDLNTMCVSAQKYYKTNVQTTENNDELVGTIMNIYSMIKPCYDNYVEQFRIKQDIIKSEEVRAKSNQEIYVKTITDLRDSDEDFKIVNTNYHYQAEFDSNKSMRIQGDVLKRINDEVLTFSSLPISYDAIIISRTDVNYQTVIRTLITGPVNTPYEGGCFIFDTFLHSKFPDSPPHVWFLNTGKKRMNPNLYDGGKVCLSILGTWGGDRGGEIWNPKISTLGQIYKSIQCQILIEQPFFNEPGHESSYNTSEGMKRSRAYNDNIKLYTMQHTMYDLINNPKMYPQFEDVIRAHFKLKKNKILEICDKWTKEAPQTYKSQYEAVFDLIKVSIEKL